eukprot:scaffold289574_cov28-Tisochrysis_lutea.AAC.1
MNPQKAGVELSRIEFFKMPSYPPSPPQAVARSLTLFNHYIPPLLLLPPGCPRTKDSLGIPLICPTTFNNSLLVGIFASIL